MNAGLPPLHTVCPLLSNVQHRVWHTGRTLQILVTGRISASWSTECQRTRGKGLRLRVKGPRRKSRTHFPYNIHNHNSVLLTGSLMNTRSKDSLAGSSALCWCCVVVADPSSTCHSSAKCLSHLKYHYSPPALTLHAVVFEFVLTCSCAYEIGSTGGDSKDFLKRNQ